MISKSAARRMRISRRISSVIASERPLLKIADRLSEVARNAFAEANSLTIEEIDISVTRLPRELDGLRVAHLSDIHHSPFTDIDHIASAVRQTNALKPDVVMLTGDYVSHESEYIAPMAETLADLESEFGTYACLGNHDHWTDAEKVTCHLSENRIRVLVNEGIRKSIRGATFWLAGVDDYMVGKTDIRSAMRGSLPEEMKLLLAHNPVIVRQAARRGVDLVLSGHTHGGQVKIRDDENRILPRRRLTSGLHRRYDTQIYITRGIGTVVLPVRYQCPPEISLITLRKSD